MTKIEKYMDMVLKTEARDISQVKERLSSTYGTRITHAIFGLYSESEELIECVEKPQVDLVNLMEECGDHLWYIGLAVDAMALDKSVFSCTENLTPSFGSKDAFFEEDFHYSYVLSIIKHGSKFSDLVKKSTYYGKPLDKIAAYTHLNNLVQSIAGLLNLAGYTLEDAMERNSAKLLKRYNGGFTEDKAINRDLATEREILEKKKNKKT